MAYFLIAFFALGSVFMTWKAVQLWRDARQVDFFIATFAFLPFGKETKRGEVRSLGLTAASLWGITALIFLGSTDVELTGVALGLFVVALGTVLLCVMLEVAVVLFNTPRFVVPPHMRSDLGVIAARRARRTKRRERSPGR
ncbi:hypothetical protein [Streptomyces sp. NPDC050704]|uniref:hypothetical protein n=1 Tax=Streptomyces sp. NPDC050704 TaxID=3157219 RepID=UPI00341864A2